MAIETSPDTEQEVQDALRHEWITIRAHEISQSEDGGSDLDNWLRAERELALRPDDED